MNGKGCRARPDADVQRLPVPAHPEVWRHLPLNAFGFESKRAGQLVIKEPQSLPNNPAHAQDIVTIG
jgi:hypothetical protein